MTKNLYKQISDFNGKAVNLTCPSFSQGEPMRGLIIDNEFYFINFDRYEKLENEFVVQLRSWILKEDVKDFESGKYKITQLEEITPNSVEETILQAHKKGKQKIAVTFPLDFWPIKPSS